MGKQTYKWLAKEPQENSPSAKLIGTLKSSFGLDLFKGLGLTIKEFFSKDVTIHYPMEVLPLSPRYRAVHHLQRLLDSGNERCIGCGLCEKICTSNCIRIITHKAPDERKYIDSYTINLGRCIYCGLCAEVCPELAIVMGQRFENSSVQRSQFGGKAEFLTDIESAKDHSHKEFAGFGSPSEHASQRMQQTPLDYATEEKTEEKSAEKAEIPKDAHV
ncbi:NADH-quinone oxidoreductase subunit NuoI [Helicobacter suis]|uniref:NADH-quinone oxidoreductase subunit NuoI n=1 Tax=Helicobacter suis TaxID=104628 RepID=UPI0019685EED|nr:NADH-quinone oxidoreductase subunit NuoI [Helicobacter suis]